MILAAFFVCADRGGKMSAIIYNGSVNLVGTIFQFSFTKNYNIAFSLPLSGLGLTILVSLLILVIMAMAMDLVKKRDILALPLLFVISGAASNLYDRLIYGYVIDYLDLSYFTVFNLADVMISTGLIVFLLLVLKQKKLAAASSPENN